jgi:hypothetical protein
VLPRFPPTGYKTENSQSGIQVRKSCSNFSHPPSHNYAAKRANYQSCEPVPQAHWYHAHLAIQSHTAPPVPPTVKSERDEEHLEESIGFQIFAMKDNQVEYIGYQDHRPAEESSACGEPDADESDDCGDVL